MRLPFLRRRPEPAPEIGPEAGPPLPAPSVTHAPDFTELENQARYHRDRVALYRARMHGSKPTSVARLEELERASIAADERLRTARRLGRP